MKRKQRIGRAFGAAAATYADRAAVQKLAAERLAALIATLPLPPRPRVLEIGCGAGLLTRELLTRLPGADLVVTDLSPQMVEVCRDAVPGPAYAVMDGERPAAVEGGFDLVCSGLALQWFETLEPSLARLCALLRPGGRLAVSTLLDGSFAEWRQAHTALGFAPGTPDFAAPDRLQHFSFEGAVLQLSASRVLERHADGRAFLRTLRDIGAHTPAAGHRPLPPAQLRRVLERFEASGASVTYHLGYGVLRRPGGVRGVFVTGSDTGVGKTVVSAILARALGADYWKPVQTGVATEPADTQTVTDLAGCTTHPPAYVYPEPLSPHAAAALADDEIRLSHILVPDTDNPLVVEGAGGVMVPLNGEALMIDLIERVGLPVVVAVRSTLGTINHSLLTLDALRRRGLTVAGVVMVGPPSASNRQAIERYGKVAVLAEIPWANAVTAKWVEAMADAVDVSALAQP